MDSATVVAKVKIRMGSLYSKVSDEGFNQALEEATAELGWTLPISDSSTFKCQWFIKRATRWALNILKIESAHKFRHKNESLQHRFAHYTELLKEMDEEFERAMMDNPSEFAGVDAYNMFGLRIAPGFKYDAYGTDITFDDGDAFEGS
jgi:hypothetical protein